MTKPAVHLICNAHLDPVWQWQWEEGCSEALSTFRSMADLLNRREGFIFNHNEALLYDWIRELDPPLFRKIQGLVSRGRWHISGGWYLQPDVNLPGTESIIRQIIFGRRFFRRYFSREPFVAYNFDSFGHSGGLPQVLIQSGYRMYIHMRPRDPAGGPPAGLYVWRGVDGSEILAYRIHIGLYHTEFDNIEERIEQGVEEAIETGRDTAVFWGIGDHGGGATLDDLERIEALQKRESRIRIIHSTPEAFCEAVESFQTHLPVFEGEIQHVFTGCYTSLSRLKRRSQENLGRLVQAESLRSALWWASGFEYPVKNLDRAWESHLFNDFHDILPGTCIEPAERDALDLYGKSAVTTRRMNLESASFINRGKKTGDTIPLTVINTNPALPRVPIEVEFMISHRPKWEGSWSCRIRGISGQETAGQEEPPEARLPFNGWRRKYVFLADLPPFGAERFNIQIHEGDPAVQEKRALPRVTFGGHSGLIEGISTGPLPNILNGPLLKPLLIRDTGDSWGSGIYEYGEPGGNLEVEPHSIQTIVEGPVRTLKEAVYTNGRSRIRIQSILYPEWPQIELRLRILWNEERKRLKLSIPTVFPSPRLLCEVPGGAAVKPGDGREQVHGRWLLLEGGTQPEGQALGLAHTGMHGFDSREGEIRLSVLRSAAYCHEREFDLDEHPAAKYMDQGAHDFKIVVTAGTAEDLRTRLPGLADWLDAPPLVFPHLPAGRGEFRFLDETLPGNLRILAIKRSEDRRSLILRIQECSGIETPADVCLKGSKSRITSRFRPFEIKTFRVEPDGQWKEVTLTEEDPKP